jgi:predicted AlkP superfamily phosphohydrolase/phosphomutase/tetratricopeptide (TPR) repeat protein
MVENLVICGASYHHPQPICSPWLPPKSITFNAHMTTSSRRIVLIGWDGADWNQIRPLLEAGELPTLAGLISRGVHGNLASLQPMISPMLWTSIATGKLPSKHGVHGFVEPDPQHGGIRPYSSLSRSTRAIWNILHYKGKRCHIANWWASHPAEPVRGSVASNLIIDITNDSRGNLVVPPGTFYPPESTEFLGQFRVAPSEITAAHVLPFVPEAASIDQASDTRLRDLRVLLAECATTQAITTAMMEDHPWDFVATYNTAIDHFSHGFMEYDPPQRSTVSDSDFRIYQHVVRGAYRFHDMMLQRILELAGPDATVIICSDHGFQAHEHRPRGIPREPAGPIAWHRPYGIFVMAGPGIRQNEVIHGASVLDITPTILHLFGLPVGSDMDGRPLLDALQTDTQPLQTIPSWDRIEGDFGELPEDTKTAPRAGAALMEQFAALGYIDANPTQQNQIAELARIEANFNLARNLKWIGQNGPAQELLENLVAQSPWENRFILHLLDCYLRCGAFTSAESLLDAAFTVDSQNVAAILLRAKLLTRRHQSAKALVHLARADQLAPSSPAVQTHIGDAMLDQRRYAEALAAYEHALALDKDAVEAHLGRSTVLLRLTRFQECIDAALKAIDLVFRLPRAHYNLGAALARWGEVEKSRHVFATLLKFAPDFKAAHRWLSVLHRLPGGDAKLAEVHRTRAVELAQLEHQRPYSVAPICRTPFQLPSIPPEAERLKRLLIERPDHPHRPNPSGLTFHIVSGIPRSGTSLMMQILERGGMALRTDGVRSADGNNPVGYYEWEAIKGLANDTRCFDEIGLENRAFKVVSPLLSKLPRQHHYKVLFMTRDLEEVAHSQTKMLVAMGQAERSIEPAALQVGLQKHLDDTRAWLTSADHIEVLEVDYAQLMHDPQPIIDRVVQFFGKHHFPTAPSMPHAINRQLHRNLASPRNR